MKIRRRDEVIRNNTAHLEYRRGWLMGPSFKTSLPTHHIAANQRTGFTLDPTYQSQTTLTSGGGGVLKSVLRVLKVHSEDTRAGPVLARLCQNKPD